jgi:integrase
MATVTKRVWTDARGKRKEAWRVAYTDQSGKRRFKQFTRKKDADAYELTAQWEVKHGVHTPDADSITVADAADLWLATAETNGCDRGTLKSYGEMARCHIKPLLGAEKLSRLTSPKVVGFADAMVQTRSRAMASKAVRALSMIVGEAQRRRLVNQNVVRGVTVKRSTRDRKRVTIPPKEHLRAILEAADRVDKEDPRLPVLMRVAMFGGLRSSELRGLALSHADLNAATLQVCQRADRWGEIGSPKSDAGHRTIPIGPSLVSALRRWKLRCPPSEAGLMFPNERGQPISQHRIIDLFLSVQVEAGLAIDTGKITADGETIWKPRYGLHSLRHAAASAWINQGVDLKRLQVWIGHATIQLTIDTYGHLITDAQGDASLASGAEAALLA